MRGPPDTFTKSETISTVLNGQSSPTRTQRPEGASDGETPISSELLLDQYGWMINSEECDKEIWEELEQEALIEEMFEKELERDEFIYFQHQQQQQQSFPEFNLQMQEAHVQESVTRAESQMRNLSVQDHGQEKLNPNATEFIPRSQQPPTNN